MRQLLYTLVIGSMVWSVSACSPGGLTCGPGTHVENGVCLPDGAGTDGTGGATGTDGTIDEESQLILELKVFGPSDDWETEEEHDEQIALSWAKLSSIVYNASHKSKLKARCRKAQRITQFKERYEKYVRDFPKNVILFPTNKNKENP